MRSAGSAPGEKLNPAVVAALAEWGIDIRANVPKRLTDEMALGADVIVTMGCGDSCPVYPGKRYLDWELADPAGRPLDEVRTIRDEIARRVDALVVELVGGRLTPVRRRRRGSSVRDVSRHHKSGRGGIRTPGGLHLTRFRGVRISPLCHPSAGECNGARKRVRNGDAPGRPTDRPGSTRGSAGPAIGEEGREQAGRFSGPHPRGDRHLVVEPGVGAQVVERAAGTRLRIGGAEDERADAGRRPAPPRTWGTAPG